MVDANRSPGISQYGSVDPAPPSTESDVEKLKHQLLDENIQMFQRMRAVFSLRNNGTDEACLVLCSAFTSKSALLRHELAYVLGQMQNSVAVPTLIERLSDLDEHIMVRHEAAEAMGAIGDISAKPVLERFLNDENIEVAESCEVALDLLNWCQTTEWEEASW
ncbi:MAG: HEAT repeat domain-containing protein [Euryarchaeota archaeon]|jgi:deoxyhypusine monooxygenase|nr:HEAT repeat domain-containing protein [Euryarchaeota archaeon]